MIFDTLSAAHKFVLVWQIFQESVVTDLSSRCVERRNYILVIKDDIENNNAAGVTYLNDCAFFRVSVQRYLI
jgi:hypothetical protein